MISDRPPAPAPGATPVQPSPRRSVWLTRRSVVAHVALVIWIPGCAVAAYWQVGIALGGDALGWVYSVMWPCFAVFGTIFWWFLVHDDPDSLGARALRPRATTSPGPPAGSTGTPPPATTGEAQRCDPRGDDEQARLAQAEADDPELAAYNAYLAAVADQDKTWRRR